MNEATISSFNDAHEITLALLPIVPCLMSGWGSSNIIYMVLRAKRRTPYSRILFGMSCFDFISSVTFPLHAFLVPKETSELVWAVGNARSCSALGFLQQMLFTSLWYSGMLSFYFLLTIRCRTSEQVLARRYEPWMHGLSIGYPLVTAIIGLYFGIYDELQINPGCWITNYPKGCDCTEGADGECCLSPQIAWVFGGLPVFLFLVSMVINYLLVYCHVRQTIRRGQAHEMERERQPPHLQRGSSRSFQIRRAQSDSQLMRIRAVATQAFLYVGVFFITYSVTIAIQIMSAGDLDAESHLQLFPLMIYQNIFFPLQGFFNCLVYVRPTYLRVRKKYPMETKAWAFWRALHGESVKPRCHVRHTVSSRLGRSPEFEGSSAHSGELELKIETCNSHEFQSSSQKHNNSVSRGGGGGGGGRGDLRLSSQGGQPGMTLDSSSSPESSTSFSIPYKEDNDHDDHDDNHNSSNHSGSSSNYDDSSSNYDDSSSNNNSSSSSSNNNNNNNNQRNPSNPDMCAKQLRLAALHSKARESLKDWQPQQQQFDEATQEETTGSEIPMAHQCQQQPQQEQPDAMKGGKNVKEEEDANNSSFDLSSNTFFCDERSVAETRLT